MYLLDTNVISETRRPRPNQGVMDFISQANHARQPILLSVITLGELMRGIEYLRLHNDWQQARVIEQWFLQEIEPKSHLAVPFDRECGYVWGRLMAKNPQNATDKLLVATAIVHDLVLVTRNVKHIGDTGVKFFNPFS